MSQPWQVNLLFSISGKDVKNAANPFSWFRSAIESKRCYCAQSYDCKHHVERAICANVNACIANSAATALRLTSVTVDSGMYLTCARNTGHEANERNQKRIDSQTSNNALTV